MASACAHAALASPEPLNLSYVPQGAPGPAEKRMSCGRRAPHREGCGWYGYGRTATCGWGPPPPPACGWVPPPPPACEPCQPVCFQALAPTTTPITPNTPVAVAFTQVLPSSSPCSYYDATTGLFTAPYTGDFSFGANVAWASAVDRTTFSVYIFCNGATTSLTGSQTEPLAGTYVLPVSGTLSLSIGDIVGVGISANQSAMVLGYAQIPNAISSFRGGAAGACC